MNINQKELASSLGDEAAIKRMDHEARADALEDHMSKQLDAAVAARRVRAIAPFASSKSLLTSAAIAAAPAS